MIHRYASLLRHYREAYSGLRLRIFEETLVPVLLRTKWGAEHVPQSLLEEKFPVLSLEESNERIRLLIDQGEPALVSRFGGSEMRAIFDGMRIFDWKWQDRFLWWTLSGQPSRWRASQFEHLALRGGFFPWEDELSIRRFASLQRESASLIDHLGSWIPGENLVSELRTEALTVTELASLEPFFSMTPWTKSLEGKNVLVVHPFSDSIQRQYRKRKHLFKSTSLLPDFNLLTVKAVQSLHDPSKPHESRYSNWFSALDSMWQEIVSMDYDVAIIGCGAYGMPLGARVKRAGKVAVHLGGSTQLLFGIWGGRWDQHPELVSMRNEYWSTPSPDETPRASRLVSEPRYW